MSSTVLDREQAEELAGYIRSLPDCFLTASTRGPMYIENEDEEFIKLLTDCYHNDMRLVKDVLKEDIEIIKMSLYRADGVKEIAGEVTDKWKNIFNTVVAGVPWIDFMDFKADKGFALETIQKILRIQKEETMAFGDNHNDLGMMRAAGESYAVANARAAVKEAAKHLAEENVKDGVLKVLKQLLKEMGE